MQKPIVLLAFAIFFLIFFAVVLTLQYRRERRNKCNPDAIQCQGDEVVITTLEATSFDFKGQIAPTKVYQADTDFSIVCSEKCDGALFVIEYPNENENDVVTGFAISDIDANSVVDIPCAVGWNMIGTPNSSTCTTDSDIEGWSVAAVPVRKWTHATGVEHIQTLASASENKYSFSWNIIPEVNVYAVSVTLVGESYDQNNVAVPTKLSFGGLTSKNSFKLTTVGSNHFTADIPVVESVKVVGFNHCDIGIAKNVCLGSAL